MPEKTGDIAVEREKASVKLVVERDGEADESHYISPEHAAQMALWLNQAAAEAKQYAKQERGA